jgi:hypothetical protein
MSGSGARLQWDGRLVRATLENSRKTGAVSSAPPEGPASFFAVWRRASASFALLRNAHSGTERLCARSLRAPLLFGAEFVPCALP